MNGVYSLPDGTYSYAVMLDGYLNVAGSFTVAGKDLTVTVRLEEGSNVWTARPPIPRRRRRPKTA